MSSQYETVQEYSRKIPNAVNARNNSSAMRATHRGPDKLFLVITKDNYLIQLGPEFARPEAARGLHKVNRNFRIAEALVS